MKTTIKSGVLTTELWVTVAAQGIPFFVIFGVLTPEEGEALALTSGEAIAAVGALLAGLAPVWAYIKGRAQVKAAANGTAK